VQQVMLYGLRANLRRLSLPKIDLGYYIVVASVATLALVTYLFLDYRGSVVARFLIGVSGLMPLAIFYVWWKWKKKRPTRPH